MRLQELGHAIRRARMAQNLTQARLAAETGLSRPTLNQLESGLVPDLGVRKVKTVLDRLGLSMSVQNATKAKRPDFLRMACTTASVSFTDSLTEDELVRTLLSGKVAPERRPHFRALLEEASPSLLMGLVEEVRRWSRPGRVEKNLGKIAEALGTTRKVSTWLKTG